MPIPEQERVAERWCSVDNPNVGLQFNPFGTVGALAPSNSFSPDLLTKIENEEQKVREQDMKFPLFLRIVS